MMLQKETKIYFEHRNKIYLSYNQESLWGGGKKERKKEKDAPLVSRHLHTPHHNIMNHELRIELANTIN